MTRIITAIIIDDEKLARESLALDLKEHFPHINVVGEAWNITTGINVIREQEPDLIFLDVQLTDGTGFQILEQFPNPSFKVIFTTAYDKYAIEAFDFAAVDYLLKPFDRSRLQKALERVSQPAEIEQQQSQIDILLTNQQTENDQNKRIVLPTQKGFNLYTIKEIIRLESNSNYTELFFTQNRKLIVAKTIKKFETQLIPMGFLRVHRSHIVNFHHVSSYLGQQSSSIRLSNGDEVPVSVRKKQEVIKVLRELE